MPGYYCECESLCTRKISIPASIFDEYPQLFSSDDYQFIVAGCPIGADINMSLVHLEDDFQIYKRVK